jgi:hypothetical protein
MRTGPARCQVPGVRRQVSGDIYNRPANSRKSAFETGKSRFGERWSYGFGLVRVQHAAPLSPAFIDFSVHCGRRRCTAPHPFIGQVKS